MPTLLNVTLFLCEKFKGDQVEEFLTVDEFCRKTKYARQSVYNMINKNIFKLNEHFYKPTPKKILFKTSAIELWLAGENGQGTDDREGIAGGQGIQNKKKSLNNFHI